METKNNGFTENDSRPSVPMRIYLDFDDVISESARRFGMLVKKLFGIDVPYSRIRYFNLQKAFGLNDDQYTQLLEAGHTPENLLSLEETPGASETINKWAKEGHEIYIITGRPLEAYAASRTWLDEHGLQQIPLFCADKYRRYHFDQDCPYCLSLEKLYSMSFDLAVEDSPEAFEHVMRFEHCRVAVFDRPWNRNVQLPGPQFRRCCGWQEIDRLL